MSCKHLSLRKTLALALLALGLAAAPAQAGSPSQTGQGIMVKFYAQGAYAIDQNLTYEFNPTTAAGFYTNAWDGQATTVVVKSTGSKGTQPPTPAAPGAPDADPARVTGPTGHVWDDVDTFADGGPLSDGDPYTQTKEVVVADANGKATWTFTYTYTYTITAKSADAVAALTAYDLKDATGDSSTTAHVTINADIAGESVVKSSNAKVGTKYSFSLLNVPGDQTSSRVTDLNVTITDANGNTLSTPATSTVNCPVDFAYTTNAGSNGATNLLKDGEARTILNTDSFAGNNNGGADGSALSLATMDAVGVDLPPGNYAVTLTGTVKDNGASAAIDFKVTQAVHIKIVKRH